MLEAVLDEQPPGPLRASASQVEIGTEHDRGILQSGEQMRHLVAAGGGTQPLVADGPAGIEVRAQQGEGVSADRRLGPDRHAALEGERQLDALRRPQWERREDRVAPIAPLGPVPHGRHVPKIPPQGARDLHDILRRAQTRHQLARGMAVRPRGDRVVLPECLLDQQHGGEIAGHTECAGLEPLDQLHQPTPSHPHVPAHHREPRRSGRAPGLIRARQIERDGLAHVPPPAREPGLESIATRCHAGGT